MNLHVYADSKMVCMGIVALSGVSPLLERPTPSSTRWTQQRLLPASLYERNSIAP